VLDYGPHTAVDQTDAITQKPFGPRLVGMHYVQQVRPHLTDPYKLAETAERILLQMIAVNQQHDPMARLTETDLIERGVSRAMKIAKALHAEFKILEDEVEKEAEVEMHREIVKCQQHQRHITELLSTPITGQKPDLT